MQSARSKAELQSRKQKLVNSYNELFEEFSSKDLGSVGNYTLGSLIGKGSFGKVYLATHKLTNGSKVVLKSANKDDANLAREIHHHRQFLHPHIARLYEVIVTESLVWLVLEYCPGDELYTYLCDHGPLPKDKVQRIFTQLVGAVSHVHNMHCVHRDLKLENILLDKHGNVKLCDFGFTREYQGSMAHLQTFCGTICYSAPEMIRGEKYAGEKVDVWSLGIILYALLAGELPYDEDDDTATKQKILTTDPEWTSAIPEDAKDLITQMLSKRPLLRPSLEQILAHPFLEEHAPHQREILARVQPPPFSTELEKETLLRLRSAGVSVDRVIENVLAQRCDALAGWWALLIEKERRKAERRERKRRERDSESRLSRRASGASSRRTSLLQNVDEEGDQIQRRGRRDRRSFPNQQLVIPELPRLPEGLSIDSPKSATPPPPIEKDPGPSGSTKVRQNQMVREGERRLSRSSAAQLASANMDLLSPTGGIAKRRGSRRHPNVIINQLASLKHWFVESAKRAKSPGHRGNSRDGESVGGTPPRLNHSKSAGHLPRNKGKFPDELMPTRAELASAGSAATTAGASAASSSTAAGAGAGRRANSNTRRDGSANVYPQQARAPRYSGNRRTSLSPAPLTPHSAGYRRSGLHGRKSTSSSVSSIRSIHHVHTHSKASSTSSNAGSVQSSAVGGGGGGGGSKSIISAHSSTGAPRSPSTSTPTTSSVKVLPATPKNSSFPSNIRLVRAAPPPIDTQNLVSNALAGIAGGSNSIADSFSGPMPSPGLVFAKRKTTPFRGPMMSSLASGGGGAGGGGAARSRDRESRRSGSMSRSRRRSRIVIEEEEEDEDDDEVEEVDTFSDPGSGAVVVVEEKAEAGKGKEAEVRENGVAEAKEEAVNGVAKAEAAK